MEPSEYSRMYELEDSYWWFVGLRCLILSQVKRLHSSQNVLRVLDAGCGTGANLRALLAYANAYGVDRSSLALEFCKKRSLSNIAQASVSQLPFPNGEFNLVVSTDVLYHRNVEDDQKALEQFFRVLKPKGKLILHLPAYEFLRGNHDAAIHTKRRYSRQQLESKRRSAGFQVERISYRNTFLFPVVWLHRVLIPGVASIGTKSDLRELPLFINKLLTIVLAAENRLLNWTILPFGSSLFCLASKS